MLAVGKTPQNRNIHGLKVRCTVYFLQTLFYPVVERELVCTCTCIHACILLEIITEFQPFFKF